VTGHFVFICPRVYICFTTDADEKCMPKYYELSTEFMLTMKPTYLTWNNLVNVYFIVSGLATWTILVRTIERNEPFIAHQNQLSF
jgi:hypothetical protein